MKQLISWKALELISIVLSSALVFADDYEKATYFILGAIWCHLHSKEEASIVINNATS